jgi:hypothetical protein
LIGDVVEIYDCVEECKCEGHRCPKFDPPLDLTGPMPKSWRGRRTPGAPVGTY